MIAISNTTNTAGINSLQSQQVLKQNQDVTNSQQSNSVTDSVNAATVPESTTSKTVSDVVQTNVSAAYSVEISPAGASLNAATTDNPATASTATQSTTNSSVAASSATTQSATNSSAAASSAATQSTAASSTTTSTEDLTQYSNSQLQQMLSSGKITQGQYNTAMAGRLETATADSANTLINSTATIK